MRQFVPDIVIWAAASPGMALMAKGLYITGAVIMAVTIIVALSIIGSKNYEKRRKDD
jgi:hypothetical protein